MNRLFALLVLSAAAFLVPRSSVIAQQQPVLCNISNGSPCATASNPGNGQQGDPAWLSFGKVNANLAQIYSMLGNTGTLPLPLYGVQYNNNGTLSSLTPSGTGTWCLNWTSLSSPPTLLSCAGGGTVTSIGLTLPSWLSVSPSSISTSGTFAVSGTIEPNNEVLASCASGSPCVLSPRALVAADIPSTLTSSITGNAGTATALSTTGSNGSFWGVSGGVQGYFVPASFPSCASNQMLYYAGSGTVASCLTLGTNLAISGSTLNASGGVTSFSGDGALLNNSASTGAVTNTLANTGLGYGVWGNIGSSSGAPSYHALSSYPTAAFPTLNQSTTGNAATATTLASGLGTGVTAALADNVGSAGAFVVNGGALGTPSSGTATNLTGLPVSSGISGLGTGVATALADNVGSAGAFVTFNGALGTPSSGSATNLTNFPTLNQNTTGNAATATALATTPVQCTGSQFATGVAANGNANCTTPAGSGNVSTSGSPIQFQTPAWASGTTIQGIGPGTAGQAYVSGGASAYPSFSSTLNDVTSVNGTSIPASATLVISGGALGTPSSGSAANLTGFPTLNQSTTGNAATATALNTTGSNNTFWGVSTGVQGWYTPAGGGNVSNSGTPAQYDVGIWTSSTTIAGVAPSSTTGEAFVSNGTSANPGFSTSLAGVTSINSSTVPGSTTLAGLGASETWTALQTFGTNISIGGVTATGATGTGNAVFSAGPTLTGSVNATGSVTDSYSPVASASALTLSGAPFTGGSGTTTFPLYYLNDGTAPTTWSTAGTEFGVNAPSGFTGNFVDFHVNGGASVASISATGALTVASCAGCGVSSFSGDGALITNTSSTGAVTAALGNTGVGYGVWGNTGSSSGAPGYHALSSYSTAAFPTLNQNTTGTAANLSGTPALPNGTTATTQSAGDTTTKLATDAFVSTIFAAPPAIGNTTPAAGAFTTLSASSTVSGTGFSTYLASPPAIGGTAAAAGAFTTLSASSTVSGTGFSTYLASPPAIGGTAPSTGAYTTLSSTGVLSNSKAGAASTASVSVTGAPYTAGSATTNFPLVYLNDGTGPTTLSTAGTELGVNAPSGFTGNFLDFHVNGGASVASLSATGALTVASCTGCSTPSFSAITNGTNSSATMNVGTGATLQFTGSGLINANELNGGTMPASAAVLASNSSSQPVALTLGNNLAVVSNVLEATQAINPRSGTAYSIGSNSIETFGTITGGSSYTNGTYTSVALTGGTGTNAVATIVVSGGAVTSVSLTASLGMVGGSGFTVGDTISANASSIGGTGSGFSVPVTALYNDAGKLVTSSNAGAVAWTLAQATTTGYTAGFAFDAQNVGTGTVTITPTTSTINGQSTLVIPPGAGCTISSDGANYQVSACTAIVTPTNMAILQAATTFTITPTGCTPSAYAGGPFGGTITLASGPCTSIVVTLNGATGFTDSAGYDCSVGDQTTQAAGTYIPKWGQSAQSSTTVTIPIPAAAGTTDVISFHCTPN